jgi:hypothetical protein
LLQKAWNKGLNAEIIAWPAFDASTFHIYTKFKPKISEKTGLDLTGRKMRSTGLYNPLLKAMNALPINISPSDVLPVCSGVLLMASPGQRGLSANMAGRNS